MLGNYFHFIREATDTGDHAAETTRINAMAFTVIMRGPILMSAGFNQASWIGHDSAPGMGSGLRVTETTTSTGRSKLMCPV